MSTVTSGKLGHSDALGVYAAKEHFETTEYR